MPTITVRLPESTAAAFKARAKTMGVTPSRLGLSLIEECVSPAGRGEAGPVEAKLQADLDALVTGHPMGEALSAMAVNLARSLDSGAGMATAAINRELRETLADLAAQEVGSDDDEFASGMSTPMGDAEDDF